MKRRLNSLIILLTVALSSQSLYATTLEETFKKRVDASGINMLIVHNVNGKIDLSSWSNDEIEIIAYKKVHANSLERAKRLMEALQVDIMEDGKTLQVETNRPRNKRGHSNGFFTWLFEGGNSGTSISYEVKVPRKMDLDIRSTNGGLLITDCEGEIMLATTNGKIRAEDISGSVKARSTNGSLNISMRKIADEEEMSFKTTNGSIKLYLPYKTDADIEARTTNGKIRCELPMSEMYEKSKRRLEGEINDGGPLIYMKTTNGSINIMEY